MLDITITADNWYYLAIAVVIIAVGIAALAIWVLLTPDEDTSLDENQDLTALKTAVDGMDAADKGSKRKGVTEEVSAAFGRARDRFAGFINSRTNDAPTPPTAPAAPTQGGQPSAPPPVQIVQHFHIAPGSTVQTDQKSPEGGNQ